MPAPLRQRYAAHLIGLTKAAPQLLVTFEYDQTCRPGPPFSVMEAEVREHYSATYLLKRAEIRDVPSGLKGADTAQESVWLLSRADN